MSIRCRAVADETMREAKQGASKHSHCTRCTDYRFMKASIPVAKLELDAVTVLDEWYIGLLS